MQSCLDQNVFREKSLDSPLRQRTSRPASIYDECAAASVPPDCAQCVCVCVRETPTGVWSQDVHGWQVSAAAIVALVLEDLMFIHAAHISEDLSWSPNTTAIIERAQQRLYVLSVKKKLLVAFYTATTVSLYGMQAAQLQTKKAKSDSQQKPAHFGRPHHIFIFYSLYCMSVVLCGMHAHLILISIQIQILILKCHMASSQSCLGECVGDPDTMWFHGLMRPKLSLCCVCSERSTSADLHQPRHEVFFFSAVCSWCWWWSLMAAVWLCGNVPQWALGSLCG